MNKQQINILVIFLTVFSIGCAKNYEFNLQLQLNGFEERDSNDITEAVYSSMQKLSKCDYLRDFHSEKFQSLQALMSKAITIDNYKDDVYLNACGAAARYSTSFRFDADNSHKVSGCYVIEYTVAHEIMHLLGFTHSPDDEIEMKTLVNECRIRKQFKLKKMERNTFNF